MDEILLFSDDGTSTDISNQLIPDLTSSMTDMMAPFLWLSVGITIVFIVLYVSSILRKRKVENAIFDIQKIVSEMNERDKARSTSQSLPTPLQSVPGKEPIIARVDESKEIV